MKTLNLKDNATAKDLLKEGRDEDLLIVRDGHAVALLMPFDDDDAEWYARERDPAFIQSIARARRQVADGKVIGHEALKRKLGLD